MAHRLTEEKSTRKSSATAAQVIVFPNTAGRNASIATVPAGQALFTQGELCEAVFYLHTGAAKIHVVSPTGQEAVTMLLGPGDFCGEGCLLDSARRVGTVTTLTESTVERIEPAEVRRRLGNDPAFTKAFLDFLITRNRRYLVDLSNHHFNTTEQRLAMTLLRLANGKLKVTLPYLNQETLAGMIGTTRPRVNLFLNKFRRLGMIAYSGKFPHGMVVHKSLSAILDPT